MSDKPININIGSLLNPKQERSITQKNKPVDRETVFSPPDGWDGAVAWSLTWISIGGLFVAFSRFVLWMDWAPICIPAAAIAGLILFVVEAVKHPSIEVGMALGLVLAGCILGVLH